MMQPQISRPPDLSHFRDKRACRGSHLLCSPGDQRCCGERRTGSPPADPATWHNHDRPRRLANRKGPRVDRVIIGHCNLLDLRRLAISLASPPPPPSSPSPPLAPASSVVPTPVRPRGLRRLMLARAAASSIPTAAGFGLPNILPPLDVSTAPDPPPPPPFRSSPAPTPTAPLSLPYSVPS
ncbi:hypothetical protein E2562_011914 [Oryza meyeriana var. granulata]|uniref:Uncharacterized protein n=1 Tax=Oryza meyeriana var. granulata TaxID=110450 RepID=A0A6G1CFL7_9ORYZ|nr:hypothetical protein E2562_011914 [Oryza meyeriana var. granulata]